MDTQMKAGQLYLQPRKSGKKWKPVRVSLFPPSRCSVGRLEIQHTGATRAVGGVGGEWPSATLGPGGKRHQHSHGNRKLKVVRLSEVISVLKLPPHAEALPKENMSAFCVETEERTWVFATMKGDGVEWVEKLCEIAFQQGTAPQIQENQIYSTTEEACGFSVVVQQSDAMVRGGLQGTYWLQVGQEGLVLREAATRQSVWDWPYKLLRRYGKDKLTLSIEAGRRCDSGPGTFVFHTGQANAIFSLIEDAIQKQRSSDVAGSNTSFVTAAHLNQEREGVMLVNRLPRSPLPKIPDMLTMSSILENNKVERVYTQPADLIGPSECVYTQPLDSISLLSLDERLHSWPENTSSSESGQSEPLYTDLVDCMVQSVSNLARPGAESVYVDPASILPLKPPSPFYATDDLVAPLSKPFIPCTTFRGDQPDPIYSEVYDNISPVRSKPNLTQNRKAFLENEPIYTVPVRMAEGEPCKTAVAKPDPFSHLYAQVCKPTPSSRASSVSPTTSSVLSSSTLPCLGVSPALSTFSSPVIAGVAVTSVSSQTHADVIYENLGVI